MSMWNCRNAAVVSGQICPAMAYGWRWRQGVRDDDGGQAPAICGQRTVGKVIHIGK
jgi:hypothetical protein